MGTDIFQHDLRPEPGNNTLGRADDCSCRHVQKSSKPLCGLWFSQCRATSPLTLGWFNLSTVADIFFSPSHSSPFIHANLFQYTYP